jgi:hypothetical protein
MKLQRCWLRSNGFDLDGENQKIDHRGHKNHRAKNVLNQTLCVLGGLYPFPLTLQRC